MSSSLRTPQLSPVAYSFPSFNLVRPVCRDVKTSTLSLSLRNKNLFLFLSGYMDEDDGILMPLEEEEERVSRADGVTRWRLEKEARLESGEAIEEEAAAADVKPEEELGEEDLLYQQARQFEIDEKEKLAAGQTESDLPSAATMAKQYDAQKRKESDANKLLTLDSGGAGEAGNILDANAKRMGNLLPAIFKAHVEVPTQKDVEAALLHRRKMELLKQYVSDELMETENETQELMGVGGGGGGEEAST